MRDRERERESERERERGEWPDISCYNPTTSIVVTKGHFVVQRD